MQREQIKAGHRFFIGTHKKRRVVAHVTNVVDSATGVAGGDGASSIRDAAIARFLWRNAAYHHGWSRYEQQLPLSVFAHLATEEVAAV